MAKPSNKWTRDEHILVFNLYCRIPFGRQHSRAPEIIELAKLLGRSRGSVALKLNNFSRLDPELKARGVKGMAQGAKGELDVWRDFEDNPRSVWVGTASGGGVNRGIFAYEQGSPRAR